MNRSAHAIGAALGVGGFHACWEKNQKGAVSFAPLASAGIASLFGSSPDWIEPAIHPNHRQFFHSLAFAGLVIYGLKRTYDWKTESDGQKLLKFVLLSAGGAYLVHLLMDASTSKSIPVFGK